jgi:trafficking protein particle complex subunit 6
MSFEAVMPPYNASDPTATFMNSSCLDFLLIELVPLAYRVTNELEPALTEPASTAPPGASSSVSHNGATSSAAGVVGGDGSTRKMDEEEERDAVFYRLEMLGYRVGQGLVERYAMEARRLCS